MKTLQEITCRSVLNEAQIRKIEEIILKHGRFTQAAVREELDWFCTGLVMSSDYFKVTPIEVVAKHIEAIMAAEIMATAKRERIVKIDFATEHENEAVYLVDDAHARAWEIERRIEEKYPAHRWQCFRTSRKAAGLEFLRMYLVYKPDYGETGPGARGCELKSVADRDFIASVPEETLKRFERLLCAHEGWESPLVEVAQDRKSGERRIQIVVHTDACGRFFSNISDVLRSHNLFSNRKFVERFANGKSIFSIYLGEIADEKLVDALLEDISLVYAIPDSPLSELFRERRLTAQETVFGVSVWSFAHQFLSGYNEEYLKLAEALKDSLELQGMLRTLKTRLSKDTYQESRVWEGLAANPDVLKQAYRIFDKKFNPARKDHKVESDLAAFRSLLGRVVSLEIDRQIFQAVALFIETAERTNFYLREKTALSYFYNPVFLNTIDYPETPFGIIHIVGAEFRGFHVRFRDIARGGIRIVRSPNLQTYMNNSDFIFDENYNLAWTQQRKNKDIPEGGSKGTILLNWGFMDKSAACFKKYVDGLLDLMLPHEAVIGSDGRPLLLFLGPDEGTADFMEWAALRAKHRGYGFWKAFSTGKPAAMGGIPHDLYGMTTNSVRQYELGAMAKLGLKEETVTKVMTGGPDGDLGSNEILMSKARLLAVVDGSGVLYDPKGIDQRELVRLAKLRKTVDGFPKEKLGPGGFFVGLKDRDVSLPGGEKVESGLEFRNGFHLHPLFKADLFVPCGGRPSSVTIANWTAYLNADGTPRFKAVIEGANLFFTQQARLRLEERGVIVYKDASANKGGVTSSSLEVLAGLVLTDEEFDEALPVRNGKTSEFRRRYVEEIIAFIRDAAVKEFEIIWKEHEERRVPRSVLTDLISEKINAVKDSIAASGLIENKALVRKVVAQGVPPALAEKAGIDKILKRLPEPYLRALVAARIANAYVYKYGLGANEIAFYEFLKTY